jgi:hypothetical protein
MKKLLLSLIVTFLFQTLTAQMAWCPPGATWHIKRGGFIGDFGQVDGIIKISVTKDTSVIGVACKRLDAVFRGKDLNDLLNGVGYDVTKHYDTYYTYSNNNVIFLYNQVNAFDTLVNFNALPGDKWLKPRRSQTGCFTRPSVVVTDTSHVIINGFSLKQIKTVDTAAVIGYSYTGQNSYTYTYKYPEATVFIERILFPSSVIMQYIFPTNCEFSPGVSDGPPLNVFKCYEDDAFPVYKNDWPNYSWSGKPCDFTTGVEMNSKNNINLSLYPNPNQGSFELELQQATDISIVDLVGHVVFNNSYKLPGKINVDAAYIPPGVYILRAKTPNGSGEMKFVVQ